MQVRDRIGSRDAVLLSLTENENETATDDRRLPVLAVVKVKK